MAKEYRGGSPRRPVEVEAERAAEACPHAELRTRNGWPRCRVCGAGVGSVGVGCAYRVGGAGAPTAEQQRLGGVHAQGIARGAQCATLPARTVADGGRA